MLGQVSVLCTARFNTQFDEYSLKVRTFSIWIWWLDTCDSNPCLRIDLPTYENSENSEIVFFVTSGRLRLVRTSIRIILKNSTRDKKYYFDVCLLVHIYVEPIYFTNVIDKNINRNKKNLNEYNELIIQIYNKYFE